MGWKKKSVEWTEHSLQSNFLMYQRTHFMCVCVYVGKLYFSNFFFSYSLRLFSFSQFGHHFGWLFVIFAFEYLRQSAIVRTVPPAFFLCSVLFMNFIHFVRCRRCRCFSCCTIYVCMENFVEFNDSIRQKLKGSSNDSNGSNGRKSGIPLFSCWFSIVYTFMLDAQECAHNTHEHHRAESKKEQQQQQQCYTLP